MHRTALVAFGIGAVVMSLFVAARDAVAHPDYEHVDRALVDNSGKPLKLVRHYSDGIIATDPCKLILRDEAGLVLGETEFARNISVACWSSSDCLAFRFDSFMPLLPDEVLHIRGGVMRRASPWWGPLGVLADLVNHWLAYLCALGVLFMPVAAVRAAMRSKPGIRRNVSLAIGWVGGGVVLLAWFLVVVMQSPLSLPLLSVLSVLVFYADRWWGRRGNLGEAQQ